MIFLSFTCIIIHHIDGLVQDCSISKALAMEILQFCTQPRYTIDINFNSIQTYV